MRTIVVLVLLLAVTCPARAEPNNVASDEWRHRVLKVTVLRHDGGREFGSAVPLSGDRMVTNCHVIRDAREITVEARAKAWRASADMRDAYRDLCFLDVPGYGASPMPMIETGQTRVGLPVVAAGYSGGEFALSSGEVTGLYVCECDGGRVIRTSARFDRGASGGGLFDQQGRLVGILTFKAQSGGRFHFALPVGWLRHLAATEVQPIQTSRSFWEQPGRESAHFLAACDLSAKRDWRALNALAADWTRQEPDNPEAWMALGRARLGTNRKEEAVEAFQQALMLESTHAEAQWELQKLEVELGRSLLNTGHM